MRVVIIEDELVSSRRLERMLQKFDYEILASLVSVKAAVKWFKNNTHPDLLFMDVHLADGLCFDIFNQVEITCPIVFTTAYGEYSIKAFDYNSVSYLLKPINKMEFKKAIEKANTFYKTEKELLALKKLVEDENNTSYKNQFVVRVGKKVKIIETDSITCFLSSDNVSFLVTNQSNYIINGALANITSQLNPNVFFRVNRKYIVNRLFIKNITIHSNSRYKIELKNVNEEDIIVSRERAKAFKKWIGE